MLRDLGQLQVKSSKYRGEEAAELEKSRNRVNLDKVAHRMLHSEARNDDYQDSSYLYSLEQGVR